MSGENVKTVLIVEDEHPIINVLTKVLTSDEVHLVGAHNGSTGLSTALRLKPDLIVLDIVLPTFDGLVLLEKLRKDVWGKHAKVMVLSNLTGKATEDRALALGALEYVVKSNTPIKTVVEKIHLHLDSKTEVVAEDQIEDQETMTIS